MSRERWGTFSVKDHTFENPYAADVLIYDRLIIPRPGDSEERALWASKERNWNPDLLDSLLEILRADKSGGRAITVPWNQTTRDLFNTRAETANLIDQEAHYGLTRRLLSEDLRPEAPPGVVPTAVLSAYPSIIEAEKEWVDNEQVKRETLTLAVKHHFLLPDPKGKTAQELLQEAVGLADDADFQRKRAKLYGWQDDVILKGLATEDALEEMEQYVIDYEAAVKRAVGEVYGKFAFTLIPIALTALGGPIGTLSGVSSIMNLVRFWIFDRKPIIKAGEGDVAAMFHDVAEVGWRRPLNLPNSRG